MSKDKKKNKSFGEKLAKGLFKLLATIFGLIFAALAIASFDLKTQKFEFSLEKLTSTSFYIILVVLFLLWLLYVLTRLTKEPKDDGGAKVEEIGGIQKYYDTNWLTIEQLKKDPVFKYHLYSDLKNSTNIGIPIRAQYIKGELHVNMYPSIHTLVIGTTGSGKTTQFVDPMIQILGESKAKPCMVITDPKGELYDNHSVKLREAGYRIIVFDLKEPFKSTCWNPLARVYDLNKRANELEKEVLVHRGDHPKQYKHLKPAGENFGVEWYEFDGFAFDNVNLLKDYIKSVRQQLKTEAIEELNDIATVLCPVESTNDPTWERGAKEFLFGTMVAMLEDTENPELGMTKDKFNFYNLSKIVNLKDNDPYNSMKTLTEYFQGRSKLSLAVQSTNQVLSNAENTKKSYMGIVSERVRMFSDLGVCYATSKNEMELETFADQPTALFIKIPDEKTVRHGIATMFISQLYKILVNVANKRGGKLPREVHFILDEFANMPAIVDFQTIITVARSRRIFFTLILQSYSQLAIKYKEEVATTVKDNCNIHVFIASNDQATLKEFSERCGNISVKTKTTSINKGKKDDQSSTSINVNIDTRPLIYPAELGSLKNEMIISILKQPPLKAVFTPSYTEEARKFYKIKKAPEEFVAPKILDEAAIYYDIKERNKKVLSKNKNDDFDPFDI